MTNPGVYQLFVYGSLRSGFKNPMYEYISRFFHFIGQGVVPGNLYDMGSYPAGVPGTDGRITGELYEIKKQAEFSWAIGQLDDYEGVNVESDEVQLYRREIVEVEIAGQSVPAWIYWFNGVVKDRPLIASGDMISYFDQKNK